jgi:hypothetical protein
VSAGDPSNPRIDIVWICAHNQMEYKDADNFVVVGVTQGTPGANCRNRPSRRMHDASKDEDARRSHIHRRSRADVERRLRIPYGASLGKIGENWDRRDMTGDSTVKKMYYEQQIEFDLPSDRMLELAFKCNLSSAGATSWSDTSHRTEWAVGFQIDGKDLDHSCANFVSYGAWQTHETSYITAVNKGHHVARLRTWLQNGNAPVFHYNPSQDNKDALWCGRRFIIWDRGQVV